MPLIQSLKMRHLLLWQLQVQPFQEQPLQIDLLILKPCQPVRVVVIVKFDEMIVIG